MACSPPLDMAHAALALLLTLTSAATARGQGPAPELVVAFDGMAANRFELLGARFLLDGQSFGKRPALGHPRSPEVLGNRSVAAGPHVLEATLIYRPAEPGQASFDVPGRVAFDARRGLRLVLRTRVMTAAAGSEAPLAFAAELDPELIASLDDVSPAGARVPPAASEKSARPSARAAEAPESSPAAPARGVDPAGSSRADALAAATERVQSVLGTLADAPPDAGEGVPEPEIAAPLPGERTGERSASEDAGLGDGRSGTAPEPPAPERATRAAPYTDPWIVAGAVLLLFAGISYLRSRR